MGLDILSLAVFKGALEQITEEMDEILVNSAFSPIISEARDRANGIYHPRSGEVIVQGLTGMPMFIWTLQATVQGLIQYVAAQGEVIAPGDVFVVNDPYLAGCHLMDVKVVKPVFVEGERVAWIANCGHWPDIGGSVPGGFAASCTEIYQEGLRIPPVRICKEGRLDREILRFIMANVRMAEERQGDLLAQLNALTIGEGRLSAMAKRYGKEAFLGGLDDLLCKAEEITRSYLKEIPDGVYQGTEYSDNDGIVNEPVKITVTITARDGELLFDFTGSDPATRGPINSSISNTMAAVFIALKHAFPEIPICGGSFAPVRFIVPPDTLLNPSFPKAVSGMAETSNRVHESVFKALATALPRRITAGNFGTVNNFSAGGTGADGREWVMPLFNGGGYGASFAADGLSVAPATQSMASNQPIEVLEQRYPVLFLKYKLRPDSAGAGTFRGGLGGEIEFTLREGEATCSTLGDRGRFPPHGVHGGLPAAKYDICIHRKSGEVWRSPFLTRHQGIPLAAGDVVHQETPGGGGYGPPGQRDPAAIARDLEDGYFTAWPTAE